MDKQTALARIDEIFKLAFEQNKELYAAWKDWNESSSSDEVKYRVLVQLVHPADGIAIGMPLAYSPKVSLWRACDVIQKVIAADKLIADWKFVEFLLKDDKDSRFFLNDYFRTSPKEKMLDGIPSLQNRLLGQVKAS